MSDLVTKSSGGGISAQGPKTEVTVRHTCFNAVKYLYFAIINLFNIKAKKVAGRPKLTPLQKSKSKASRLYWKLQELINKTPSELLNERVQFCESEKVMGRPPVKLSIQQDRARLAFESALEEYRKAEQEAGLDPAPESEIIDYKKNDFAGRPGADEIDKINRFIRRHERMIKTIRDEIDSGAVDKKHVRGRPADSREKKIKVYEERIHDARIQIYELSKSFPKHEQIKNRLNELRAESRQLTVFLGVKYTREYGENRLNEIKHLISEMDQRLKSETEKENKNEIKKLLKDLYSERRSISMFLNFRMARDEALERKAELSKEIADLVEQHKKALKLYNEKSIASENAKDEEAKLINAIAKEKEAKLVREDAFNKKYQEIEDRNKQLRAVYEKLKEEQRQKNLEAESRELEEKIRALGGEDLLKKIS
ncbi:MAG: hypothetical protein GYB18_08505 [Oceanospirillales bacterium]|nr:hypothetical protein [Oceanospirillales bacterium]